MPVCHAAAADRLLVAAGEKKEVAATLQSERKWKRRAAKTLWALRFTRKNRRFGFPSSREASGFPEDYPLVFFYAP